jgi:predicted tellurium resistance membrane protein TerC
VHDLLTTENLIAFLTLTLLEIVLGIDNVVFISILTGRLEPARRARTRRIGLALAMLMRVALLFALSWVMRLEDELFAVLGHALSGRDLILLGGGLFLIAKATWEIHDKLEGAHRPAGSGGAPAVGAILGQIVVLDIVFSLDSVITAVGMARHMAVMVTAVVVAVAVMLVFANMIGEFIERHPTMKVLALSFLILIGVLLVAEGLGKHLDRGYVYFAMAFSLGIELLNMRLRRAEPLHLHQTYVEEAGARPPRG